LRDSGGADREVGVTRVVRVTPIHTVYTVLCHKYPLLSMAVTAIDYNPEGIRVGEAVPERKSATIAATYGQTEPLFRYFLFDCLLSLQS